ncbi:MAG: hypothetical protein ACFFKA_22455 [Candidatus Thorarchaeota archaeon]
MIVGISKIQNKLQRFPKSLFGFLSVIIGLIGDLLAFLFFPEYNLTYMISALGVGPGGIFFNLGLTLSGIFALCFYLNLIKIVGRNTEKIILLKIAKIFSINSCIFYCLIGIFPAMQEYYIIGFLHGLSAIICWISAIIYLGAFGILFLKNCNFLKIHSLVAFITASSFVILLFTWNPITEWIMTFNIIIWIILIASYIMVKKL